MAYYGTLGYQHQVEKVIREWAAHFPHGCESVKRRAARIMELRGDDHGRTREGYLKGGMPGMLHKMMADKFGSTWMNDPTIRNIFWRVFAIGRFNTYENWSK